MPRAELDLHLNRVAQLVAEMRQFVPTDVIGVAQFRADLAGLLVVSMAASYENCVKETLITFATNHHVAFGNYATNSYAKLNSRIAIRDLNKYAKTFDNTAHTRFRSELNQRKERIDTRIGKNIEAAYEQILSWRHDFAHAGIRNTTIEEAFITHTLAKRVLYAFDRAFNGP